jgi:hypothetical protein
VNQIEVTVNTVGVLKLDSYLRSMSLNSMRLLSVTNHPTKPQLVLCVCKPSPLESQYCASEFVFPEGSTEIISAAVEFDINSTFDISNLEFVGAVSHSPKDWRFCYLQYNTPPPLISKFISLEMHGPFDLFAFQALLNQYTTSRIVALMEVNGCDYLIVLRNIMTVKHYVVEAYHTTDSSVTQLDRHISKTSARRQFEMVVTAEGTLYFVYSVQSNPK